MMLFPPSDFNFSSLCINVREPQGGLFTQLYIKVNDLYCKYNYKKNIIVLLTE